ncbi:hypothetical protein [Desulfohalovibrio reitneri]|uniref:hypothetical protein n=1 Tax=Desulfohalovibrio reitneri TaxID=1307759 RepID=UPI0004A6DFF7|nr:hypothetical protein [Desulfohalovibrio reitneri]
MDGLWLMLVLLAGVTELLVLLGVLDRVRKHVEMRRTCLRRKEALVKAKLDGLARCNEELRAKIKEVHARAIDAELRVSAEESRSAENEAPA